MNRRRVASASAVMLLAVAAGLGGYVVGDRSEEPRVLGTKFAGPTSQYIGWDVDCAYARSAFEDPIVYGGQSPPTGHQHDFLGSPLSHNDTTYEQMTGDGTTCLLSEDTAGYWVPSLFVNGRQILPGEGRNPERGQPLNVRLRYYATQAQAGTHFTAYPADFRLITDAYWWGCSVRETRERRLDITNPRTPVDCASGVVSLHLAFPNCWDGVNKDAPDHRSHMAFRDQNFRCPASHPRIMPPIYLNIEYLVGSSSKGLTLGYPDSSDVAPHADFWQTWQEPFFEQFVEGCFNAAKWCGDFVER